MHMNHRNHYITGLHSGDRENTPKRRGCLWKCKAFRSFSLLQKDSRTHSCLSARRLEKHHTDSREKVPYMLGGRRRCSEKAACKHGGGPVLTSVISTSVYSKKLRNRNFISIFQDMGEHTWEQSHRNRTRKELRSACSLFSRAWESHIYLWHVTIWDLRLETLLSIQMLYSLTFINVFVKSNSNCHCCNIGLRISISSVGFPNVTSSSGLLVNANPSVLCLGPSWLLLSLSWVRLEECTLPQQRVFQKLWVN